MLPQLVINLILPPLKMIVAFLYIITGLLGLIVSSIILMNFKINRVINIYLVLVFYIISIKFLLDSLIKFNFLDEKNILYYNFIPFLSLLFPAIYLYYKNIVANSNRFFCLDLLHFITPLLFGLVHNFWPSSLFPNFPIRNIIYISFFIYVPAYWVLIFFKLKNEIWKRNTSMSIVDKQNKLLSNWTTFLFIILTLVSLRLVVSLITDLSTQKSLLGSNFQWVSSIFIIVLFAKILISPEILFGYNALYKKINNHTSNKFILEDFWILNSSEILNNLQDEQLRTKIVLNLEDNLKAIEDLALNKKWFRNPDSKQDMLAIELEIPKSHVSFIFKYHSKISYTEFRKIIRVYDSIQLIEEFYLKANTLDSLASKVGFSSYNPFFTTFKEVTGTTPQAYNKQMVSQKKYH